MAEPRYARIILGITGGISAYKSPDLVRRLRERGAEVQVVMTPSGEKMIAPTVFQAVSGRAVRGDLWDEQAEDAMGHIQLARWADVILVAPATANIMSQLAAGTATGLLTTLCLASEAPLVLAPAMNQAMWKNPATQDNLAILRGRGVRFIGPAEGEQACGDVGPGRMTEPADIAGQLFAGADNDVSAAIAGRLAGVKVLISAGPTREPIDPVRYISNRSSGKMGFAVARAAADAGARVTLVAGPVQLATPAGIERINVETAAEMREAVVGRAESVDIYIGAAAISDYRPEVFRSQKIKKHAETMRLEMVRSRDVLAEVTQLKARPFSVGFAAETEKLEEYARAKLVGKNLDMIVGNLVGNNLCFDQDENSVLILWQGGNEEIERMPKTQLAERIIEVVAMRYRQATNAPTPIRQPAS
ncbi:MAG: bifunctional phosphopantothenoylcysteine decarboxylase/phosphopantothenate--cysteine ligase CoaBC [Gammaproteobacteria bacterium]|nr:MAG: bifunctional phosphopantothenoylcysteine decarboxylase/phosphopantothenate--cysteine ligase CoaBC [Gammaproteobacteria bacterium]